jgi:hypothetical protein
MRRHGLRIESPACLGASRRPLDIQLPEAISLKEDERIGSRRVASSDFMNNQPLVAYYRVSTRQQKRSGLGLEAQRLSVRAYIKACPGKLIAELTEVESGTKDDRPIIKEALWRCRVYGAKLVVARLDRLARSAALIAQPDWRAASTSSQPICRWPIASPSTSSRRWRSTRPDLTSERTRAAFAAAKARGKANHKLETQCASCLQPPLKPLSG